MEVLAREAVFMAKVTRKVNIPHSYALGLPTKVGYTRL